MWQPTWHGYGSLPVHPIGHNSPQCATTGQWIPSGQALWQSPSLTMPPGNISGCHTPLAPASAATHGSSTMPFTPGVPMQSTTPPVQIPPILHLPVGSHHSGCCPSQPALPIHHSYTSPALCHHPQPCELPPTHSTPTPPSKGDIDFKALEARLDAAFTQKLALGAPVSASPTPFGKYNLRTASPSWSWRCFHSSNSKIAN